MAGDRSMFTWEHIGLRFAERVAQLLGVCLDQKNHSKKSFFFVALKGQINNALEEQDIGLISRSSLNKKIKLVCPHHCHVYILCGSVKR